MTRKELEDLGLSKEQIDSIIKINETDVGNAEASATAELTGLRDQVADRDKQLETLKASAGDNEALAKRIADLQAENTKTKETHESEMNQFKVDFAVEKALTGAKAKNIKAVKALLDLEDIKLDKDGTVKGLQDQVDKLLADDDTKFLFEAKQQVVFRGFQPGMSTNLDHGVDTSKMGYDELCAYLAENPNAAMGE